VRPREPRRAVWKFASCDGCQLSILDWKDELTLVVARIVHEFTTPVTTTS
jgi:coenzyme F420-reducing hydrogenase gamma subunit